MKHQRIKIGNEALQDALGPFLRGYKTTAERIAAIETALGSQAGKFWRDELGTYQYTLTKGCIERKTGNKSVSDASEPAGK